MQEGLCGHRDIDGLPLPPYGNGVQRADRARGLALAVPEGRKIVLAHEALGRRLHCGSVQRTLDEPHPAGEQGGRGTPVQETVAVGAADRREARVEVVVDMFGGQDGHRVAPQAVVDRVANAVRPVRFAQIEMGNLAAGMHPGVGPPRPAQGFRARSRAVPQPPRWPVAPKDRWPDAASRRTVCHHIRS